MLMINMHLLRHFRRIQSTVCSAVYYGLPGIFINNGGTWHTFVQSINIFISDSMEMGNNNT